MLLCEAGHRRRRSFHGSDRKRTTPPAESVRPRRLLFVYLDLARKAAQQDRGIEYRGTAAPADDSLHDCDIPLSIMYRGLAPMLYCRYLKCQVSSCGTRNYGYALQWSAESRRSIRWLTSRPARTCDTHDSVTSAVRTVQAILSGGNFSLRLAGAAWY